MNRSRYVTRHLDTTDRAIIAALTENGRMTVRELAEHIGLSSPSVTERIHKLEDAGAIRGYDYSRPYCLWPRRIRTCANTRHAR
jgi:Lrp/AsnC family transcriptional regulator, leucine-responsive regulatory protein